MKISVWNLMRPNSGTIERNKLFLNSLQELDSDIVILTETNSIIDLGDKYYSLSTLPLPENIDEVKFKYGENRVTIFSKTPFIKKISTADSYSSVCAETKTAFGPLIIYGTIIGYLGGRLDPFKSDLKKQTLDIIRLSQKGNLCFAGDLNVAFSGNPYPSKTVVEDVAKRFEELELKIVTKECKDSAIHAVISNSFLQDVHFNIEQLFFDGNITDHRLVTISLIPKI